MLKKIAIITCCLFTLNSFSQPLIVAERIIENFSIDQFQNIYTRSGNVLAKYDGNGEAMQEFSHSIYGQISTFDATDPLRILVFYQESNALLFLNLQLTLIGDPIELDQLDDIQADLACISNRGGFWIYDFLSQSIIYYDANRVKHFQSQNIAMLQDDTSPLLLQEKGNQLYLSLADKTLVFDQFGGYETTIPLSIQSSIILEKNSLSFWTGTDWMAYQVLLKESHSLKNSDINATKIMPLGKSEWLQLNGNTIAKLP